MRITLDIKPGSRVDLSRLASDQITLEVPVRWCPNPACKSVDPLPPPLRYCNATCRAAWHNYLRKLGP